MANTQNSYRIRTDATKAQGGTPVWAAAEKVTPVIQSGVKFRIRYQIAQGGAYDANTYAWMLYYSKNGGTFTQVGTAGDVIYADPTLGASADGQVLTTELMANISTFQGIGLYCPLSKAKTQPTLSAANTNMEFEFGLQFVSPGCDGNKYTIQVGLQTGYNSSYPIISNSPTFSLPQRAALALTEANDTLAGVMLAPNAGVLNVIEVGDSLVAAAFNNLPVGVLNVTEANDVVVGSALNAATGALTRTEADDGLTGAGIVSALGSVVAHLNQTEADDGLAGLGTGSGNVASLRQTEAGDSLTGFGGSVITGILADVEFDDFVTSETVLSLNQWVPVPLEGDVWTPVATNAEGALEVTDG